MLEEDAMLAIAPPGRLLELDWYHRHALALDEFNGLRGDFYKHMFAVYPAGRPGTATRSPMPPNC